MADQYVAPYNLSLPGGREIYIDETTARNADAQAIVDAQNKYRANYQSNREAVRSKHAAAMAQIDSVIINIGQSAPQFGER